MGLLAQSSIKQFTPKTAGFQDVYKKVAKKDEMSSTARKEIYSALGQAGFDQKKIGGIVRGNQQLTSRELQQVAKALNQQGVSGFKGDPQKTVKTYFRQQAVKARNIAYIRKDYMQEALKENLGDKSKIGGTIRPGGSPATRGTGRPINTRLSF